MSLIPLDRAVEALGPDGPFAAVLEGFEHRQSQQEMARGVLHALREGGVVLAEAGTGTGKSLAYLVPAALYALHHKTRVVISTNTINLQEQLLHKDIPLVAKALAPQLTACLVKGWRNYVCLYRLQAVAHTPELLPEWEEAPSYAAIAEWAERSEEGSLSEWPSEPLGWDDVCAESDTCLRGDCPFHDRCFLLRARARMAEAHLLLVNHHLLFADVAVRRVKGYESDKAVLPAYNHVILDEAHHIEDVATKFCGASLSEYSLRRLLGRVLRPGHRGGSGLVAALATAMRLNPRLCSDGLEDFLTYRVTPAVSTAEEATQVFFAALGTWLADGGVKDSAPRRIRPGKDLEHWRAVVSEPARQLAEAMSELSTNLAALGKKAEALLADAAGLRKELEAMAARCGDEARLTQFLGEANSPEHVFWVERSRRRGFVSVLSAPLDIGPVLAEWLDHLSGVVCTSATLTVAKSFQYVARQLGVSQTQHARHELLIPSPFDYRRQALLAVTKDLPDPTQPEYLQALAAAVERLVRASRGRAFVLFTSYAFLHHVATALQETCDQEGWPLLVQGAAPRHEMLESFRSNNSVLLGTDSFWEGVDVAGEALSCVIITRLPFRVPDEPVAEARMEALAKQGLNPFHHLALPEAILKFKQGFGRLIRTGKDRGACVVCDRRILDRPYGRWFLDSLPECTGVSGSVAEVAQAVSEWV